MSEAPIPEIVAPSWFDGRHGYRAVRRLVWWLALFALIALPFGIGFETLLDLFEEGWQKARQEELQIRADHLLATLERRLAPIPLLDRALRLFQDRFRPPRLDPDTLATLERRFHKRFPAATYRFWFDPEGRLIVPRGSRPVPGSRAWQAFFRSLGPAALTAGETLIAENLRCKVLTSLAEKSYLRSAFQRSLEVVYEGHPAYFRILPLCDPAGKPSGSLMLFLPKSFLTRDWQLRMAVRSLGSNYRAVGGFWQSVGTGIGNPPLDGGLLHGLFTRLCNGDSTCFHAGMLYRSRLLPADPDLMISVGIRDPGTRDTVIPGLLQGMRSAVRSGLAMVFFACLALGLGKWAFDPPLQRKFLLGTMLLALPLLGAMIMIALIQTETMERNSRIDFERRLEHQLYQVEQSFTDHLNDLQKQIDALLSYPCLREGTDLEAVSQAVATLRPHGLVKYAYNHVSGRHVSSGFRQDSSSRSNFESLIINRFLAGSGFQLQNLEGSASAAANLDFLLTDQSLGELSLWQHQENSLLPFRAGPVSWYVFNGFSRDNAGSVTAHLFLSLSLPTIHRRFLRHQARVGTAGGNAIEFFSPVTPPASRYLQSLLSTGVARQSAVFSERSTANGRLYALARPLKGIEACGLVSLRLAGNPTTTLAQQFSFFVILAAGAAALLAVSLLRRRFLEPILGLQESVNRLEQGDLRVALPAGEKDELGRLAASFNRMTDGLRQKSAMTAFVRPDLASEASLRPAGQVARRRVTILFAGLRRFSDLEQTLAPRVALALMSRFLGLCDTACRTHGGNIDKFIGETAMGVFLDSPADALAAAIDLRRAACNLMEERSRRQLPTLRFGIGLATGEAVTGDIGSRRKRLDFTVIGDTVNLAARLEKLAGHPDGPVILGYGEVADSAPPGHHWERSPITGVRGRRGNIEIRQLVEEKG